MSRPENQLPAEYFYNDIEAKKYSESTRVIEIQSIMTERAIELLNIPQGQTYFILDIGCGSGLSGQILTENDHQWIGLDISRSMLDIAVEREVEGDLYQIDMGQGFNFRPGIFDAVISISALQWLCVAGKKIDNPFRRLNKFFQHLYNSLRTGGRAVLQFYPDGNEQIDMITKSALKAGFSGGLVVDYPNSSKAKKLYLVLDAGGTSTNQDIVMVDGLQEEEEDIEEEQKNDQINFLKNKKRKQIQKDRQKNQKPDFKSKVWIFQKKERQRKQGKEVRQDTKYTGRKRNNIGQLG